MCFPTRPTGAARSKPTIRCSLLNSFMAIPSCVGLRPFVELLGGFCRNFLATCGIGRQILLPIALSPRYYVRRRSDIIYPLRGVCLTSKARKGQSLSLVSFSCALARAYLASFLLLLRVRTGVLFVDLVKMTDTPQYGKFISWFRHLSRVSTT